MCLRNEIKKIRQLSLWKAVFFLLIILRYGFEEENCVL